MNKINHSIILIVIIYVLMQNSIAYNISHSLVIGHNMKVIMGQNFSIVHSCHLNDFVWQSFLIFMEEVYLSNMF